MDIFFKLDIPHIIFYIVTALWLGEFFIFPSKYDSSEYSEKSSFKKILFSVVASIAVTVIFTYLDLFNIESGVGAAMKWTGIATYILGIGLRYIGTVYLGKYFTRDIQVSSDMELVSDGPYRILRHPLYLGLFLLSTGVPLFFRNPVALLFATISVGKTINDRMDMEEKSMEEAMGDTYRQWKKNRYRFIPYIY